MSQDSPAKTSVSSSLWRTLWKAMRVQKDVRRIMNEKQGEDAIPDLRALGREFGISERHIRVEGGHLDPQILVERIQEAARSVRDGVGWVIAFVAAMAAVLSAIGALITAARCL